MFSAHLISLAQTVLSEARIRGLRIVTAESCTGGLVAGALTEVAGSSDSFDRGFVTYSNEAKMQVLGVPLQTLQLFGAVSEATAMAMAEGALKFSSGDVSVAITGIAGPGGDTTEKPVGLVHFAASLNSFPTIVETRRFGSIGRSLVRLESVEVALNLLLRRIG